jgi:hypothetical protein
MVLTPSGIEILVILDMNTHTKKYLTRSHISNRTHIKYLSLSPALNSLWGFQLVNNAALYYVYPSSILVASHFLHGRCTFFSFLHGRYTCFG